MFACGRVGWLVFEKLGGTLVGFLDAGLIGISLLVDPVNLSILSIYFIAHINGHVT
jgi:hypothetical protein